MKKNHLMFISILSLLPVLASAKNEDTASLENIDFIKITKESTDTIKKNKILVKDGNNKDVEVELNIMVLTDETENFIKKIENNNMNLLIHRVIKRTINGLKNPYSFIPRKINVMNYGKSNDIVLIDLEYTAENSYGANLKGNTKAMISNDEIEKIFFNK